MNSRRALLALPLLGVSLVSAQGIRFFHEYPQANQGHGYVLARAGDLDGDGIEDLWVGSPGAYDPSGGGAVFLVSGRDGTTLRQLDASGDFERFGESLAAGRDLSGDGIPDVVVGAPRAGTAQRGAVRVFSGATGERVLTLHGRTSLERFGESLALLDDANGDGVPEIAVGVPGDDEGGLDRGSVRIFSGASGRILATLAGSAAFEEFGAVLASAGDVDHDGRSELLVGVPKASLGAPGSGKALLLSGLDGHVVQQFSGLSTGEGLGQSVAGIEDVDGDGVRDVALGAPNLGRVRVYSGASGLELWSTTRNDPEETFGGFGFVPGGARFGWALCDVGDQDGDHVPDLAVGYPEASLLYLLSGVDGHTVTRWASGVLAQCGGGGVFTYLGFSVTALSDLDGDGRREIAAGAPTFSIYSGCNNASIGRAFVLSARPRGVWSSARQGAEVGWSVSGAGDVDRDGLDDVAFGVVDGDVPAVVVTSGRTRSVLRAWTGAVGSAFGRAIARAGDVDADGVEDLVVGDSDGAWVYSGADGSVIHHWMEAGAAFGASVAGIGDCDGDGHADVAVGAPRILDPAISGQCGSGTLPVGYVQVYSGATGAVLHHVEGRPPTSGLFQYCAGVFGSVPIGEAFGFALTSAGDWNSDGTPDFAVGAPGGGGARVFSGRDAALLAEFPGGGPDWEVGVSLAGGEGFDVNGDGHVDLAVGGVDLYYGSPLDGGVVVYSGLDGSILLQQTLFVEKGGIGGWPRFGGLIGPGCSISDAGDFDQDGHSDVALGNPTSASALGAAAGQVLVLSGASGQVLRTIEGVSSWDYLGCSVALAGDVNGDGRRDLVIGAPTCASRFSPTPYLGPIGGASVRVIGAGHLGSWATIR